MIEKKKFIKPRANVVYEIDGASYGMDDALVEAIKSSIGRRLEQKTLDIPRVPQVAGRILALSENPNTTVDEIVQLVSTDPALATRILTVANSAAYGSGDRIGGLTPALMRLGTKTVQDMIFAESVRMGVFSAKSYKPILEQSWKLSLGTAIACDAMSVPTGIEREGAFLLGLLHDTGKPVLLNTVVELERKNKGQAIGEEMVEILMSQLHEEVGGYVLDQWGMPAAVVGAARGHHRYAAARATPSQCLVYAGNLVCQHLGIGEEPREISFTTEHVFADLKLADLDRITPILDKVTSEMQRLMVGLEDAPSARAAS